MEDVQRIVLLGKTGAGKSATGNTILGKDVFKSSFSSESTTRQCEKHEGKVKGWNISVIDTPGLFHTSLTEKDTKDEIMRSLQMSAPGPHVFLLVIKLNRFTQEEENTVKLILENFGEDVKRFIIVLFTGADMLTKSIDEFLQESPELQNLVDECGGRYYVFNNKNNGAEVTGLLEKIKAMVKKNRKEHCEMFRRKLSNDQTELTSKMPGSSKQPLLTLRWVGLAAVITFIAARITFTAGNTVVIGAVLLGFGVYFKKKIGNRGEVKKQVDRNKKQN